MSFDNRIGALILAAGSSSRMGQSKQLLDVEGEKLIVKVARAVLHAGVQNVSIVLGAHEADHRKALRDIPVRILSNPEWEKGMGSSIKTGLRHYMNDHRIEAMMVAVCDQPLLSTDIIRNLINCYFHSGSPVVASQYGDSAGVPAIFGRSLFDELLTLPEHQGAKNIIRKYPSEVSLFPFPEGEVDLDTWEDYQAYLKRKPTGR